jgi:transcriptional regulator with XRE-family HTH domain
MADGRDARVAANLTQEQVGSAIGLSDSRISAMERGDNPSVPFVVVAQYLSTVGLELSARAYPAGGGLRDAAQLGLLGRLRPLVASAFLWLGEVPMPVRGDLRAWDAGLVRDGLRIGIDAETRIRDAQALDRRVMRKLRDSGWERAIILVAATRNNRYLLREFGASLRANYPISQAEALRALAAGSDPGGNSIIAL